MTATEKAIATAIAEFMGRRGGWLATDAGTTRIGVVAYRAEPNTFAVELAGARYIVTVSVEEDRP